MVSASTSVASATASGVNGANTDSAWSRPKVNSANLPGAASFSTTRTLAIANKSSASEPGWIWMCTSANSAVLERRGSTTTTLPLKSVQVGHGDQIGVSEHQPRRHVFGHLVDG